MIHNNTINCLIKKNSRVIQQQIVQKCCLRPNQINLDQINKTLASKVAMPTYNL